MGSRGIQRVDSETDLQEAVDKARSHSRSGSVIVEEYIDGPEFSLDALVEDGEVTVCGFADRHIYYPPFFIEMGHTMPTSQPQDVQDEVEALFIRGIKALGITRGAAKGDIKLSSRGPVVGEIAARLSGGFMSGWTYPASSGIDLTLAAMRLSLGLSAGDLKPRYRKYSAERAFVSIPGQVHSIHGFDGASGITGITFGYLRVNPGDHVDFPKNNVEKAGNFISRGDTREEAVSLAETAAASVFIRLEPGEKATRDFLDRRSHGWVPDAFTLENGENLQFLRELTRGPRSSGKVLADLPLIDSESCRDWQGRSLRQALEAVATLVPDLKKRRFVKDGEVAGFYQAFLRGSVQGAVWYLDTQAGVRNSWQGGGI
jgi:biotin carboxylase